MLEFHMDPKYRNILRMDTKNIVLLSKCVGTLPPNTYTPQMKDKKIKRYEIPKEISV